MAYTKTSWNNGRSPAISATNLNHIERGIEDAHNLIDAISARYGTPLTASLVSEMTETDKIYVYVGSETGYTTGNWYYYDLTNEEWVSGGVYNSIAVQTDTTLSQSGMAADAKKTGDEINDLKSAIQSGGSFNAEVKAALDQFTISVLQLAEKVAYIDENGQDYYDDIDDAADALHVAMYPPVNLSSITAVYTQSGTVYETDSLDSLKDDLVVTAHYSDSTTAVVTTYTLSGTLVEGTSTITVSYGGKTATFNVTVTEYTGEVIIDGTTLTWQSGYIAANGNIATTGMATGTYSSDYVEVNGYASYKIELDGSTVQRAAFFDSNHTIISRVLEATGDIPSTAVYARMTIAKSSLGSGGYDGTGTTITLIT